MGRTAGTKITTVTLQIKVELDGMDNVAVDDCASGAISAPIAVIFSAREEANAVTFADNDKRDVGVDTQFFACASDKGELILDNHGKLSFRDTAAIEQDPLRKLSRRDLVLGEHVHRHRFHCINDFLSRCLNLHR